MTRRRQFHQSHQAKQVNVCAVAPCDTFLKSARDAERFASTPTFSVKWCPINRKKSPRFGSMCTGTQRIAHPILAQVQPIATSTTSLESAWAVLDSGPTSRKPSQMVKKQLTKDFQFDQFDPTLSVSLEPSGETSQCLCCGTVWYLSEISTRCWTFSHQHQPSRSNGSREIKRRVHVLVVYVRGLRELLNLS